jgi:hypothetical protein
MFLSGSDTTLPRSECQHHLGRIAMKRRYALYAAASVLVLIGLFSTSYGILLLASLGGIAVLGACVGAWIGLFSLSEHIAHRAVRIWKAVVPPNVLSLLSRQ